jgi:hypothetical protein
MQSVRQATSIQRQMSGWLDNKFETVSVETFFVRINLICVICVDGLRKATQLMVNCWRETRCRLSQDSKRWNSDMKLLSFRGPKNIMSKYMQLIRPAFVHPWLVRFRLKVLSLHLNTAAGFCFVRIFRGILWKNNFPSIIFGVTRRVTGNSRVHEKGPLTSDLRKNHPAGDE